MNDEVKVNNEVLIYARQSVTYSKDYVVTLTGMNLYRLNEIESGDKNPTLEELKLLAKTYKKTLAFLLLLDTPKEKVLHF